MKSKAISNNSLEVGLNAVPLMGLGGVPEEVSLHLGLRKARLRHRELGDVLVDPALHGGVGSVEREGAQAQGREAREVARRQHYRPSMKLGKKLSLRYSRKEPPVAPTPTGAGADRRSCPSGGVIKKYYREI